MPSLPLVSTRDIRQVGLGVQGLGVGQGQAACMLLPACFSLHASLGLDTAGCTQGSFLRITSDGP